jgi:hypothetical protein
VGSFELGVLSWELGVHNEFNILQGLFLTKNTYKVLETLQVVSDLVYSFCHPELVSGSNFIH